MAATLTPPVEIVDGPLPKKRFTRDEVEWLLRKGFFAGQRYELIDGELIQTMGQDPPHASGIRRLKRWLVSVFGDDPVQIQMPIELSGPDRDYSVPEPDLAVLPKLKLEHEDRHPRADELILAVEVADTTVRLDLTRKVALYAASGLPEYWVLDITRRRLVVHRRPEGAEYREIRIFAEDDLVSVLNRSEKIRVRDLLPPATPAPRKKR